MSRAHIELDKRAVIAPVRHCTFDAFVEHLGRRAYAPQAQRRVTSASLAQLVNVIAPIVAEPGGPAWRQTTFFPFSVTSRLASGEVIRPVIEAPTCATARHGEAPVIDAVATVDGGRDAVSSSTATSRGRRGSRLMCAASAPPRSPRR